MVGLEKAIDPIKRKQCITHIWDSLIYLLWKDINVIYIFNCFTHVYKCMSINYQNQHNLE
jgi:hypothetical protein